MNLQLARKENTVIRNSKEFKVDKDMARDLLGSQRSWVGLGYVISRIDNEKYEIGTWVSSGFSYWQPPEYDYRQFEIVDSLEDAVKWIQQRYQDDREHENALADIHLSCLSLKTMPE